MSYHVIWYCPCGGVSKYDAAKRMLGRIRDPQHHATFFSVYTQEGFDKLFNSKVINSLGFPGEMLFDVSKPEPESQHRKPDPLHFFGGF